MAEELAVGAGLKPAPTLGSLTPNEKGPLPVPVALRFNHPDFWAGVGAPLGCQTAARFRVIPLYVEAFLRRKPRSPKPFSLASLRRCSEYSLQTSGYFLGSRL